MANLSGVRTRANTLFQAHLDDQLTNVQFKRFVRLQMLGLRNGDKTGLFGLGRPKADNPARGILISGSETTAARKAEVFGAFAFQPIVTSGTRPNPTSVITTALANDPQVSNWAGNQFFEDLVRPEVRWVRYATPYAFSIDYTDFMKQKAGGTSTEGGWEAIGSLQLAEITTRTAQHCQTIETDIHTAAGPTNASTTADYWDAMNGIAVTHDTTSTYLGIDRTVSGNEFWQGNTITGATQMNSRAMVDYVNYDASGPQLADYGLGIDTLTMGGTLYSKALREAEARGARVIKNDDIPDVGKFGLKKYVAIVDERIWLVHDPAMPTGYVEGTNWQSMTVALHPSARFTVRGPYDQTIMQGGARAMTGTLQTLIMGPFTDWPKTNALWTSVS